MPEALLRRIKKAWEEVDVTQLVSESIYDFDLDRNVLRIQDRDFIFVGRHRRRAISLSSGSHVIKKIRSTATQVKHGIFELASQFSRTNVSGGRPTDGRELHLRVEESGALFNFVAHVSTAHRFDVGRRYRIDLTYEVPLSPEGPLLLFSGAIQPSDYEVVKHLGVEAASKSVTLWVRSENRFKGYVFQPAEMNYYPRPIRATFDSSKKCFCMRSDLSTTMTDYDRAHYFTVAADVDGLRRSAARRRRKATGGVPSTRSATRSTGSRS